MKKFEKYPVTRPVPNKPIIVKRSLGSDEETARSELSTHSGVILSLDGGTIDSNDVAYWRYAV